MTINIELLKEFFMWASIINIGLLVLSFVLCTALRGTIYKIHSAMFKISEDAFNSAIFYFIGAYKILTVAFFAIPWIVLEIIA